MEAAVVEVMEVEVEVEMGMEVETVEVMAAGMEAMVL